MAEARTAGRFAARIARWRQHHPVLDRVVRVQEHYTKVQGSVLASSATYFGFLSFFPLLSLAFALTGFVSDTYPDARDSLITAIEQLFPGIVSESGEEGTISLTKIENAKAAAGIIGFVGVLYSGLGWVSALRTALTDAFEVPASEKRNFVVGKAVDLVALVLLGMILIVSVGVAGVVRGLTDQILEFVALDENVTGEPLLWVLGAVVGVAASTFLFVVMYGLLGNPAIPRRPIWEGALVAAIGFEVLKIVVINLIGTLGGSAFAPLAIAITLVIWINYFSRLAMYGACWAMTSPRSIDARRSAVDAAPRQTSWEGGAPAVAATETGDEPAVTGVGRRGRFDAGSAVVGAAVGYLAARVLTRERD